VTLTVVVEKKKIIEPPVCTANCGGGGGGGGGGPITQSLRLFNEKLEIIASTTALFTWETDRDATSRVVFDVVSHKQTTYAPNIGYASSTQKVSELTKKHSILITGLLPNTQYFFRPISTKGNNLTKIGNEKTFLLPTPTTKIVAGQCTYLKDYLRIGDNNDPAEVIKLQKFLKDYEGFSSLKVTGVFDQATFDAVSAFQEKYRDEVLTPWGINNTTGYVYYTTQKKINELYCKKAFPLNQNQVTEIDNFKELLKRNQESGNQGTIDFNAIGQAPAPVQNTNGEPAGLATLQNTNISQEEPNSQTASIIGSVVEGNGTTTQSVARESMIASVFGSVKNGIGSFFNSIKNFFKKDKPTEGDADTTSSELGESATSGVPTTTEKEK